MIGCHKENACSIHLYLITTFMLDCNIITYYWKWTQTESALQWLLINYSTKCSFLSNIFLTNSMQIFTTKISSEVKYAFFCIYLVIFESMMFVYRYYGDMTFKVVFLWLLHYEKCLVDYFMLNLFPGQILLVIFLKKSC